jgi:predicted nucleic-acid-binding protein
LIGLDTNVLVRVAVGDDPVQSPLAQQRLTALTADEPGFVTHIVLVEVWWVLTQVYKKPTPSVAKFLTYLCETSTIVVQDRDAATAALRAVTEKRADFADALIVAVSQAHNCNRVETLDTQAIARAGMSPLAE